MKAKKKVIQSFEYDILLWVPLKRHTSDQEVEILFIAVHCIQNTDNTVVAERTNILISLQDWSPRGVCITSEGDMLISMTHKEDLLLWNC